MEDVGDDDCVPLCGLLMDWSRRDLATLESGWQVRSRLVDWKWTGRRSVHGVQDPVGRLMVLRRVGSERNGRWESGTAQAGLRS